MKIIHFCLVLMTVSILMSGCATTSTRYDWQGYDKKLYSHYKNPSETERFIKDLQEIIVESEKTGKVPPGIYAEYGYVLYEQKNYQEAVIYFKKEHDAWPESRVLMVKMMNNAQKISKPAEKQTDAPNTTPTPTAAPSPKKEVTS